MNEPSESLGYLLADAGFDVWLGNSRGNTYCLHHVSLNSSEVAFWDFSWDEFSKYDLPAKINYVIQTTQSEKLIYVGHSEGTEIAFANFGNSSSLASYIDIFVAFAPVTFLGNVEVKLFRELANLPSDAEYWGLGRKGVFSSTNKLVEDNDILCKDVPKLCEDFICELAGCENTSNYNSSNIGVIFSHFPAGTSLRNAIHYGQSVKSDKFQKYDYGLIGNEKHYHETKTPEYTVDQFNVSLIAYYGGRDKLADATDVQHLLELLPPPLYLEYIPHYGHGDFVWGLDARSIIYDPLIDFLLKSN